MNDPAPDADKLGKEADLLWKAGLADAATERARAALAAGASVAAYRRLAGMHFHRFHFDDAAAVLRQGLRAFPDDAGMMSDLAGSLARAGRHGDAREILERLVASGHLTVDTYDALASTLGETGDPIRARLFGTMALAAKDKSSAERHGQPPLLRPPRSGGRKIISFSLFGSQPRYLRGALHNLLAARTLFPGWVCRFAVDDSVDGSFRRVLVEEGGQIVMDATAGSDRRRLLARRFLVNDDPDVGLFMVRDCDSVVSAREASAVSEWIDSGLPFHVMRDWYSHTDLMLAGLWGGIAGVFPDMAGQIESYCREKSVNTNWDQHFLRDRVWPAIRDDCMVHDRFFASHRARAFPTPPRAGKEHVGQNEHVADPRSQEDLLRDFAGRVAALEIGPRA